MNPSNVNSEPPNCSNLLTTPRYAPAINYILLLNQKKSARKIDFFSSLLGASTYYFGPDALQTIPQGENAPLNQVLLQMPAVAQDSFGQIHVRGEHANVQFRINGVQLPEGLSVFGQALAGC